MAIYDFKCSTCDYIDEDVSLPMSHVKGDLPVHCGKRMNYYITSPPQVIWKDGDLPDGGFKAGKDGEVINTRKQRREFMAKHDLVDSNELIKPPTHEEQMDTHSDVMNSVSAITPDAEQKQQMKDDGILDIV